MKNDIFYSPTKNKEEVIHFYLPFIPFTQNFRFSDQADQTIKRFACNCIVNGEKKIVKASPLLAQKIKEYAEKKALKKDAVVTALVFFKAPYGTSPIRFEYIVDCIDSSQPVEKFGWVISKKLELIKEIKVGRIEASLGRIKKK